MIIVITMSDGSLGELNYSDTMEQINVKVIGFIVFQRSNAPD